MEVGTLNTVIETEGTETETDVDNAVLHAPGPSTYHSDSTHDSTSSSRSTAVPSRGGTTKRPNPEKEAEYYREAKKRINELEEQISKIDENVAFGEYVTCELQKITPLEQALMRRDITNLITNYLIEQRSVNNPNVNLIISND